MDVLRKKLARAYFKMRNHLVTSQPSVTADVVAYMHTATPLF